ncbi:MAG: sulfotransferase [Candidatus Aminicenantes bacterium]|nr:sulfotransferase [Candidatus Aminicenantes bacterium]
MIKFAHIVNPVKVDDGSDLYAAQPVTFATMQTAKQQAEDVAEVKFYASFFPEDEEWVPDIFIKTQPLDRSVLDFGDFTLKKKLPLIKDILDRLYKESTADIFIYTNVDIALMPDFYVRLKEIIDNGYDGIVINRRTISDRYKKVEDIPRMYEEAQKGKEHPGYDCFVFRRKSYESFLLGNGCIGANWIGRILISNIAAFSSSFRIFENLHLTFHIGDDRIWLDKRYRDLEKHNEEQLMRILRALLESGNIRDRDLLRNFYVYHMKRYFHQGRPADIIRQHSPSYRLPAHPKQFYPVSPALQPNGRESEPTLLRQDPIFVVGYPRSGTTFVQSLIGTQKGIVSLHETHFFSRVWKSIQIRNEKVIPGCLDDAIRAIRSGVAFSTNAAGHIRELAEDAALTPKMLFETVIIDNIFGKAEYTGLPHVRWVEKTPHHVFHLDKIFSFYPQAKVVYVMRHPEKAIVSRRNNFLFGDEHNWPVQKHAHQWLNGIYHTEKHLKLYPESIIIVRVEDLNADRIKEMGRVSEFLKIDFDGQRLNNYKEIAKSLIYPWEVWKTDLIGVANSGGMIKFRDRLSQEDLHELLRIAGWKMKQYGYIEALPEVSSIDLLRGRLKYARLFFKLILRRLVRFLPDSVKRYLKRAYSFIMRS